MRFCKGIFLLIVAFVASASAASAASSDWHVVEGARIRLLTTGLPDAQDVLHGALQIDLKPGWKTYWRDPGSSGVAPSLDTSATPALASAMILYPAPEWHGEGADIWAGYDMPVVMPVELRLRDSNLPERVELGVFLGICEKLCIPVQTSLALNPRDGAEDVFDAAIIKAAQKALPVAASDAFGVSVAGIEGDTLRLTIRTPVASPNIELFLAGESGYLFARPQPVAGSESVTFSTHVVTRPKSPPTGAGIAYTLSTDHGAVSGTLPYF